MKRAWGAGGDFGTSTDVAKADESYLVVRSTTGRKGAARSVDRRDPAPAASHPRRGGLKGKCGKGFMPAAARAAAALPRRRRQGALHAPCARLALYSRAAL